MKILKLNISPACLSPIFIRRDLPRKFCSMRGFGPLLPHDKFCEERIAAATVWIDVCINAVFGSLLVYLVS